MNRLIYEYVSLRPNIALALEYTEGGRTEAMARTLAEIRALPEAQPSSETGSA